MLAIEARESVLVYLSCSPRSKGADGGIVRSGAHVSTYPTQIKHRVFRDSCVLVHDNYVKDLTVLSRDLAQVCV